MTKKDNLIELVKNLSPTEKRHFKIFEAGNNKSKQKNYIQLFDAVNSCKQNNINELYANLPKNYNTKNIAVEKNYLYNLLLNSLNEYHKDSSSEYLIDSINKQTEILLQKGLHKQCLSLIKKAKKIAQNSFTEAHLIRTLELEQEIYNKLQDYTLLLSSIDESKVLIENLFNEIKYKDLAFKINFKEITYRSTSKKEQLVEMENFMKDELLETETIAKTYKSKMFLYQTKAMYYGIINDEELSISYFEKMMQLMEAYPHTFNQNAIDYLLVFANVAMGKINLKKHSQLLNDIKKIETLPTIFKLKKTDTLEASFFFFTKPYLLDIYIGLHEFDKCKNAIQLIEENIDKYKPHVIKTIVLNTAKSIAIASFYLQDYKKSLKYMNQIFDDELGKYSRGHIFNMAIHYELGNEILLNSLIASTKRLLIQQNRMFKAEEIMIEFFSKIIKSKEQKNIKDLFNQYFVKMKSLQKEESATSLLYFDVIKWMDSKIKNVSMTELI